MILDCQNISKAFGTNVILDNVSFHLEDKEKTDQLLFHFTDTKGNNEKLSLSFNNNYITVYNRNNLSLLS